MIKLEVADAKSDAPLISTEFFVAGDSFDTEACTRLFGMNPTEVWRQKRQELVDRPDISNVAWLIRKSKRPLYSVDDAVNEVLDVVWPARQAIRDFADQNAVDIGINCNVTIYEDRPVYELSRQSINRLAQIGCSFGLDIFDYSEGHEIS